MAKQIDELIDMIDKADEENIVSVMQAVCKKLDKIEFVEEERWGNKDIFRLALAKEYGKVFDANYPEYRLAKIRYTPIALAGKMTEGLMVGTASKDGDCIRAACKKLKIRHTYKAIKDFLDGKGWAVC